MNEKNELNQQEVNVLMKLLIEFGMVLFGIEQNKDKIIGLTL